MKKSYILVLVTLLTSNFFISGLFGQRMLLNQNNEKTSDLVNNALNFDGVDDYINCGNILTASYTKEAWIRITSQTSFLNVISGNLNHAFWVVNGQICAGHNQNWYYVVDAAKIPVNTWTHIAVTYDAATTTMKIYKDGVFVIGNNAVPLITGDNSLLIGTYANNIASFNGDMDEVKIWNRALTEAEIATDKSLNLSGTESGLLAYYDFNAGTAGANNAGISTLLDKSINANNGTLYNFALNGASSNWVTSSVVVKKNQAAPSVTLNDINYPTESVNNLASTMEFSIDGGVSWQDVSGNAVNIASYLSSVSVSFQIRYKANTTYFASPATTITLPARPQSAPAVSASNIDYTTNKLTVTSSMQYSSDGGANWNSVSTPSSVSSKIQKTPIAGVFIDLTPYLINGVNLLIRNQPTSTAFGSAYTTIIIPKAAAAPTNAVENTTAKTFGFTLNPLFTNLSDYEYSTNGGTSYQALQSNPIILNLYTEYLAGSIIVRVKAVAGTRFAGISLTNQSGFVPVSSTSPVVNIILSGIVNDTNGMSFLIGGSVKAGDPFLINMTLDRSASTDSNPDVNIANFSFADLLSKINFSAGTFQTLMTDFTVTVNKNTGYFSVFNSLFKLEAYDNTLSILTSDQIPSQLNLLSFDFKPISIMYMGVTLLKFDFTVNSAQYTTGITTDLQNNHETQVSAFASVIDNHLLLKNTDRIEKISITNLNGMNVYSSNIVCNDIDIAHLPKGIYIVTLTQIGGQKTSLKVVR